MYLFNIEHVGAPCTSDACVWCFYTPHRYGGGGGGCSLLDSLSSMLCSYSGIITS